MRLKLFCRRFRKCRSFGQLVCIFLVVFSGLGLIGILQFVISAPMEWNQSGTLSKAKMGVVFAGGMQGHFQHFTFKEFSSQSFSGDMDDQERELALERDQLIASHKRTTPETRLLYPGWERRLPGAIIIGVRKCGTRALIEFLRMHPDVVATGPEPHFFDHNYHRGLKWYRSIMPMSREGTLTMEKTPRYFITPEVPERVHNMSANVKLLLVVCDPVTRLISDYSQMVTKQHLERFEQWIIRNGSDEIDSSLPMVRTGFYNDYYQNWLSYFRKDQILIIDGMQLIERPWKVIKDAERFLSLRNVINRSHFYMEDGRGFPCVMRMDRKSHHCLTRNKGRKHPYVDPEILTKIRNLYKPYNEQFFNSSGIRFSWV